MSDIQKNPPWRPTKYRPEMCQQAYEALCTGGTLAHVAVALDVDEETVEIWRGKHPDFSVAIKRGLAHAKIIWLEKKERGMNPGCWVFSMKNIFDWRDKVDSELSGPNKKPIQIQSARELSDDELAAIASGRGE